MEIKLETRERDAEDTVMNLDEDWNSKFEGVCEEYEQRLELVEK